MIQGEPLEETKQNDAKSAESVSLGPVMQVPDRADDAPRNDDALSIAMGLSAKDDSLDTDVQGLVDALADVEQERDDDWMETAQTDPIDHDSDKSTDKVLADLLDDEIEPRASDVLDTDIDSQAADSTPDAATSNEASDDEAPVTKEMAAAMIAMPAALSVADKFDMSDSEKQPEDDHHAKTGDKVEATTAKPAVASVPDTQSKADTDTETKSEPSVSKDPSTAKRDEQEPEAETQADASPNLLGLQAINVLNEKISATEDRYDGALTKIGHALGVIAERIDGLEGRMTSQTIDNVAMAAAPPEPSMPSSFLSSPSETDDSVAPYIAQAERELAAKKESGPMDIFDRIAKAAETEFDGERTGPETRILENSSDGRRVGTKRWQPSKTVKRRMEQLEKAKNGEVTGDPTIDIMPEEPRSLRADVEEITSGVNAPNTAAATKAKAKPMLDIDDEIEEDDDAGLSVVPGARGRRRNRARKSRLDEDFENVFEETEGKPSIQSLRRKMRERPVEEPVEEDAPAKGGMLSGILSKKSAKKSAQVDEDDDVVEIADDDDDLMAAFDAPSERAAKTVKKGKAKPVASEDDDDEDWGDEESSKGIKFAGGPILYVLIAGAAAAAFFLWQRFMG